MQFNVKICPVCGQVWEKDGHINRSIHHGTDWPMKSYLDKGVCFGCRYPQFVQKKSIRKRVRSA